MSTNLGPRLTDDLVSIFSGDDLRRHIDLACILVTQGADGYPHPCMVTPGELVAGGPTTMRVALYAESSASRNLKGGSPATLCLAHHGAAYYVKADSEQFAADAPAFEGLAVFTLTPRHVLKDAEPPAEVTSGFRFRDARGDQVVLERWEPVVAALKGTFA